MRRRSYLALTASALATATAGCTSAGDDPDDSTAERTTTRTTSETATTSTPTQPAVSVTVDDLVVQPAALTLQTDYLTVQDGGQYVFAWIAVDDGEVERDEVALRFAGETYEPLGQPYYRLWRGYNAGEWSPHAGGLVVFELPGSAEASDPEAVLTHPGGERELDAELRTRLAAVPEFSFEVSVPDTVAVDGSLSVAIAVTNEGDTPARFVGALNRSGPMVAMQPVEAVRPLVPPGESTTLNVDQSEVPADTPDDEVGDGEPDAAFTLNTVAGSEQRSVRVVASS